MFERFTASARQALVEAQHESRSMGHGYIGTEHILLGMLKDTDSLGADVLASAGVTYDAARASVAEVVRPGLDADALATLGIDLHSVREAVEDAFGSGALDDAMAGRKRGRRRCRPGGGPPFTPRAKKVAELALREALTLGVSFIGTEHLLLGILREGNGVASVVIARLAPGVDVRTLVLQRLRRVS